MRTAEIRPALVAGPAPCLATVGVHGDVVGAADKAIAAVARPDMTHLLGDKPATLQLGVQFVI